MIFTVGLMKDPRPLVDHCYEIQIEDYVNGMSTGSLHPLSIDADLFKSLHTESTLELPGDPLHNKYINYYKYRDEREEKRPFSSRLYVFNYMQEGVVLRDRLPEATQIPECTMYVCYPDEVAVSNILQTVCNISNYQRVTNLFMYDIDCTNLTAAEAPILSTNTQTLVLYSCDLHESYLRNMLRQLFHCSDTLHVLKLEYTNLRPVEEDLDELLEYLVSNNDRAEKSLMLILGDCNMSDKFKRKWKQRCKENKTKKYYIW